MAPLAFMATAVVTAVVGTRPQGFGAPIQTLGHAEFRMPGCDSLKWPHLGA